MKGCDSRTLVALLQEELVDKDRLYVIGVPCDGMIDRRRLEKEFADEIVDISFVGLTVTATTRSGEAREFLKEDILYEHCRACNYPNPRYADDLAADTVPEPDDPGRMWADARRVRGALRRRRRTPSWRRCSPPASAASPASTPARSATAGTSA